MCAIILPRMLHSSTMRSTCPTTDNRMTIIITSNTVTVTSLRNQYFCQKTFVFWLLIPWFLTLCMYIVGRSWNWLWLILVSLGIFALLWYFRKSKYQFYLYETPIIREFLDKLTIWCVHADFPDIFSYFAVVVRFGGLWLCRWSGNYYYYCYCDCLQNHNHQWLLLING